jgi:hypothetical protein
MSHHIPWAETAQLTEPDTTTAFVGTLRACLQRYASLPMTARTNALLLSDAAIALPGKAPGKILEHAELTMLLSMFDLGFPSSAAVAPLIAARQSGAAAPPATVDARG